jgi:hypothetical protein
MKRLVMIGLFSLVFSILWATSVCGQEKQLNGHWEGAINQPAGELKIVVEFSVQGEEIKGTFTLPASAVFKWPLRVNYATHNVKFGLPTGLTFDGTLLRGDHFRQGSVSDRRPRRYVLLEP